MIFQDARIPVAFAPAEAGPDDAELVEGLGFSAAPDHPAGCACCGERSAAGRAMAALLQARARGQIGFFRRLVVVCTTEAGRAQVLDALRADPVASACFRPE